MGWLITGDCHSTIFRFVNYAHTHPNPANIIILGDAGFNYFLDNRDDERKDELAKLPLTFYLVRGNHEARPESLIGIETVYDEAVQGEVRVQPRWPQIKYLMDGGIYTIQGLRTLVIGGAYSVDKLYRLATGDQWFQDEQLNEKERADIFRSLDYTNNFDLVLTHTCPIDWEPTDLFLKGINQSTIDNTMEQWLKEVREKINWKIWLFGHFHDDRLERPGVEMFFQDITPLSTILKIENSEENKIGLSKSPQYYY